MAHRIGIDIGGVLMQRGSDADDTSFFSTNYLKTPAFENTFTVVRAFVQEGHEVWLISKCSEKTQAKTEEWLHYHDFYRFTGVDPTHVIFTRERKDKLAVAENLKLTHFIDDRLEVLQYMIGTVEQLYLFNPVAAEVSEYQDALMHVQLVTDWHGLHQAVSF